MRRPPRLPLIIIALSLLAIVVAVGGYAFAGSHSILPGIRGCELVRDVPSQTSCVQAELMSTMDGASGAQAGLRAVDQLASDSPLVTNQCHLAMHAVGEKYGRRAAKRDAFPQAVGGSSTCRMGYTHGLMLGFVGDSDTEAISEAIPRLCNRTAPRDGAPDEANCAHVLGHLIARAAGQADAERSIAEACDTSSPRGARDAAECVRGGYMEIAMVARQPPLATWRRRCEKSPAQNRAACFAWLPPIAAYRKLDRADAEAQCEAGGPDAAWREDCVDGIAKNVS